MTNLTDEFRESGKIDFTTPKSRLNFLCSAQRAKAVKTVFRFFPVKKLVI